MSRSYGSSILQYLGTAPIRRPYAAPCRGPISSDYGSSRRQEPWPAAMAAWANVAERQAQFESVGKTLPSFSILSVRTLRDRTRHLCSPDLDQSVSMLPARAHMHQSPADLFGGDLRVRTSDDGCGFALRG